MHGTKVTFCIVDDIDTYANSEIKTTIRNISDFTISNLYIKGYKVLIGKCEDNLLKQVTTKYAVVMSPGTEYINGFAFFKALDHLLTQNFFVAGHILDRTEHDAYYELHHQCYVINIDLFKSLKCPTVGILEKNVQHTQIEPYRSTDNYHDDYTPLAIAKGTQKRTYTNRCHGWNLLRLAFENDLPVIVFDQNIRNNKKHYYPENEQDYYKNIDYIQYKLEYCEKEFVHTDNTEWTNSIKSVFEQVVIPASGTLYLDLIDKGRVVFYDYNQRALDYWKENCPRNDGIEYFFVKTDLLNELSLVNYLDPNLKTLVNLSNIFCYEGTAARYSLKYRVNAQNKIVKEIENKVKNVTINFTLKADSGH